jgi:hypothetical protein
MDVRFLWIHNFYTYINFIDKYPFSFDGPCYPQTYSLVTNDIPQALTARELHSLTADSRLSGKSKWKSDSKLCYNPKVTRPVFLGVKPPSAAQDHIFVTVRQLRVCWCGAPSLTRGRVCRLQLLLAFARTVILGSESQIRHSPKLPIFISPRNRVAQLYPQALGSLCVAHQLVLFIQPRCGPHRKHRFQQLLHCCVFHNRYVGMAVSLAPQFLLWPNTSYVVQIKYTHYKVQRAGYSAVRRPASYYTLFITITIYFMSDIHKLQKHYFSLYISFQD